MKRFNASENPRPYTGDNHVLPRYRSMCSSCVQLPDSTPQVEIEESEWVAGGGFWDDSAIWDDDGFWND